MKSMKRVKPCKYCGEVQGWGCWACANQVSIDAAEAARIGWHVQLEKAVAWTLALVGLALVGFVVYGAGQLLN